MHLQFADDINLSGSVDADKGENSIQRDLDKLKEWTQENLMSFTKAKSKGLAPGLRQLLLSIQSGKRIDHSPAVKDLRIFVDGKQDMSQ